MKYEWESNLTDGIFAEIEKLNKKLPYGFAILGVAVENEGMGEACYISMFENDGSVVLSDLMSDVLGDVRDFYNATIENRKV